MINKFFEGIWLNLAGFWQSGQYILFNILALFFLYRIGKWFYSIDWRIFQLRFEKKNEKLELLEVHEKKLRRDGISKGPRFQENVKQIERCEMNGSKHSPFDRIELLERDFDEMHKRFYNFTDYQSTLSNEHIETLRKHNLRLNVLDQKLEQNIEKQRKSVESLNSVNQSQSKEFNNFIHSIPTNLKDVIQNLDTSHDERLKKLERKNENFRNK